MNGKRFSIDIYDNSLVNRVFKVILGIACLVASGYFIINLNNAVMPLTTTWIAIIFLALFGLWGILSGIGITDRYISIEENKITLRQNPLAQPETIIPGDLSFIDFGPLTIVFHYAKGNKTTLRLGTYNSERSAAIMEEVKAFCLRNNIEAKGIKLNNQTTES